MRSDANETRLTIYATTGARQLDALMPATVSGPIQVIVRTRYTPNGGLREGRLPRMVSQV